MGSDAEGVVHLGIDAAGDVTRLDLSQGWRQVLTADHLGEAVTQAWQQACEVRVGDWADAVAAAAPRVSRQQTVPSVEADAPPWVSAGEGAVRVRADGEVEVAVDPGWAADCDDETLRAALLSAMRAPGADGGTSPGTGALGEARTLQQVTLSALSERASRLPTFLSAPIHTAVQRVHTDVVEALELPVAGQSAATEALRAYTHDLGGCLRLARRPAGLPEAADTWAGAAITLTAGLARASTPRRPLLGLFRRGAGAYS